MMDEQLHGIDGNNPWKVLADSVNSLHQRFGIANHQGGFSSCQFNEVVACEYQNEFDQYIPWHADSCIYGDKDSMEWMNVYPGMRASICLESPGAVAFAPKKSTEFGRLWYHKRAHSAKEKQRVAGVRGVLALFPGDLMITCGTFHENMVQKTLPLSAITSSTIVYYPAVNLRLKTSLEELVGVKPHLRKRRWALITFKGNLVGRWRFKTSRKLCVRSQR